MRLGVVLSPVDNWQAVVEAAQLADDVGLDSLGTDMLDRIRELGGVRAGLSIRRSDDGTPSSRDRRKNAQNNDQLGPR